MLDATGGWLWQTLPPQLPCPAPPPSLVLPIAEQFEHAYNFRFEEPGAAAIITYPRQVRRSWLCMLAAASAHRTCAQHSCACRKEGHRMRIESHCRLCAPPVDGSVPPFHPPPQIQGRVCEEDDQSTQCVA